MLNHWMQLSIVPAAGVRLIRSALASDSGAGLAFPKQSVCGPPATANASRGTVGAPGRSRKARAVANAENGPTLARKRLSGGVTRHRS